MSSYTGAQSATVVDRNKKTILDFFNQAFNHGDLKIVDRIVAANYHYDGQPSSAEDVKEYVRMIRGGQPDFHIEIVQIAGEGDTVAIRWEARGTNTTGPDPTGIHQSSSGCNFFTFDGDGKVTSNWKNGLATLTLDDKTKHRDDSCIYKLKM